MSVFGSNERTLLAMVLPILVTLISNTLNPWAPLVILVFTEGGSISNHGKIGSIQKFTGNCKVVPCALWKIFAKKPFLKVVILQVECQLLIYHQALEWYYWIVVLSLI